MSALDPTASASTAAPVALRFAPAIYAATLFLSALLLFLVQPMFTKMVLPRLGGSPTVWSVAMVFFQGALLAGYLYAHLLRRVPPGLGALVHLGVLAGAALTFPIAVAPAFGAPPESGIALWLIGLLAASIGLPFAALAASAPLLQGWFAATGHVQAKNPYVLYAASNLGSFAALIVYPIVAEPLLTLRHQAELWSAGFAILALAMALASLFVARATGTAAQTANVPATARQRVTWAALAAVPSGLVIAVTSYITTDIAAAPFLWVLPLALYLLTFVAVFRDRPWISRDIVVRSLPFVIAPLSISLLGRDHVFWLAVTAVNVAAFVLIALLCHGELYKRRPAPALLTEFYLWVSFGGVLGGIFAALVSPQIFTRIYEYPILIAASLLALPGFFTGGSRRFASQAGPILLVAALVLAAQWSFALHLPAAADIPVQALLVGLAAAMLLLRDNPVRLFGLAVLGFVVSDIWQPGLNRVETARSFFGVHQVVDTANGQYRLLYHGTTLHGAERIGEGGALAARPEPLTYYYFGGPISEAIAAARAARGGLAQVAAVGLGTGSLACHRHDGETWTFYEIDPDVVRIARDPRRFNFLSACAPDARIVLGDARLTLTAATQRYDLIVLDAFSSDAIPVHLLTREALAGYRARLMPGGMLVLHISNRHLELASVVAAVGTAEGLLAYVKQDDRPQAVPEDFKMNAMVAALASEQADLGDLPLRKGWRRMQPDAATPAWTDDYSDILGAMLRRRFGR